MLVVSNWKAYVEDIPRAKHLFSLAKRLRKAVRVDIILAPAAPHLALLANKNKSRVQFAVQDVSATTGGPHTAEITAQIARGAGAKYAIVGHSERRALGDTNAVVAQKLEHAIAQGLAPILCVGESERDTEGKYLQVVRSQITEAIANSSPNERTQVIVAYEPLWAINRSAEDAINVTDLSEMVLYIRKVMAELLPGKAGKAQVLYGGSVEPENIRALAGGSGVDGFLVGHASVDAKMFAGLVRALA